VHIFLNIFYIYFIAFYYTHTLYLILTINHKCIINFSLPNKSLSFQTPALLISTSTDFNVRFTQLKASKMFSSEHKSTLT